MIDTRTGCDAENDNRAHVARTVTGCEHSIAMTGPFPTEADACAVQHCKRGETLDCQVDDDDPALVMASPPAPFTSARLVSIGLPRSGS